MEKFMKPCVNGLVDLIDKQIDQVTQVKGRRVKVGLEICTMLDL